MIWRYLLGRLLLMVPTLIGVLAVTFLIIQFVPGGPVEQMVQQLTHAGVAGEAATAQSGALRGSQGLSPDEVAALAQLYGFDRPPLQRLVDMLLLFALLDLGESFYYHQLVGALIQE